MLSTTAIVFVSPISDSAGTTNACSSNNGGCAHLCLPKPNNQKTCACTTGFYPSQDGSRCEHYESFAIVSTPKYIRGFHINSSDHSEAMVPVGGRTLAYIFYAVLCCVSLLCIFCSIFCELFVNQSLHAGSKHCCLFCSFLLHEGQVGPPYRIWLCILD